MWLELDISMKVYLLFLTNLFEAPEKKNFRINLLCNSNHKRLDSLYCYGWLDYLVLTTLILKFNDHYVNNYYIFNILS